VCESEDVNASIDRRRERRDIANGVELVFIRGSRSIAVIQLGPGELRLGEAITLLKTGIVKPLPELLGPKNPGEAAVAFF
jgi:hypothetical protein